MAQEKKTLYLTLSAEDFEQAKKDPSFAKSFLPRVTVDKGSLRKIQNSNFKVSSIKEFNIKESDIKKQELNVEEIGISGTNEDHSYDNAAGIELASSSGADYDVDRHFWTYEESKCFIEAMKQQKDDLNNLRIKKQVFNCASEYLKKHGFSVPAALCQNKWKNLMRSYRTAKVNRAKTGRGPHRFLYFDMLNEFLDTESNDDLTFMESFYSEEDSDHTEEPFSVTSKRSSLTKQGKKRKFISEEEKQSFVQLKKEEFRKREERHNERMRLAERQLNIEEKKIILLQNYLNLQKQKKSFKIH